ncbi:cell surface protein [Paucilactobacillus oligofermentans DSM 15707 = LMG 22743]|uniref:Cell surface protein n=1 Tax=Paucilactobacillus oligofermentans DSM 15707 = LMG 22743 TaxID=1423778 RepID=A0A0R1RQV1_9LACO|nr:L,D-transpeptidase [Paucilactobacillus oligofermentans]KRL55715.1 cell surface protein [Paucilactobacillus oligofermentans DSM 15707 = LMG 22743]CUS27068.1 Putative L,D-transpeptidase YciB [Paucilactobacillus oligofermentans DSM 15707 = LMG 22743]
MNKKVKQLTGITIILFLAMILIVTFSVHETEYAATTNNTNKTEKSTTTKSSVMNKVNWKKSSEKVAYPDLSKYPNAWIHVSLAKNRTYIMNGNDVLYTMYCSTGSGGDNATPTGTYYIQAERGTSFYSAKGGEGANYWVSWKDHGVYLFHTVPVDENGNYILSEAKELGKESNSHGCVRLSVPDAKWIYNNVPEGMKVSITKN